MTEDLELELAPATPRDPFNLKYGPRPDGTPGRRNFELATVLGLERQQYRHCLRILRHICFMYDVDETQSISFHEEHVLQKVFDKFLEIFPEFNGFQDRYWAPRALLYVALKSSTDIWRKNNPELAAERAAARAARIQAKAHKKRGVSNPKGRPKGKGKDKAIANARESVEGSAGAEDDSAATASTSSDQVSDLNVMDTETPEDLSFFSSMSPTSSNNSGPSGSDPTPLNRATSTPVQTHNSAYTHAHNSINSHDYNSAGGAAPGSVYAPASARVTAPAHTSRSVQNPRGPPSGSIHAPADTQPATVTRAYIPNPAASGFAHVPANTHTTAQAHTNTHSPDPACAPTSCSAHSSSNTHVSAPTDTHNPAPAHGSASGVTHEPAGARGPTPAESSAPVHVPISTQILDLAHDSGSAEARSRVASAILALSAAAVPMTIVIHVHPADLSTTDPRVRTASPVRGLAPKPRPNARSRSNEQTQAGVGTQGKEAFGPECELGDTPSASEPNRPIESDSEAAATTAEGVEVGCEILGTQDKAQGGGGGRGKLASTPASESEPAPAASRGGRD